MSPPGQIRCAECEEADGAHAANCVWHRAGVWLHGPFAHCLACGHADGHEHANGCWRAGRVERPGAQLGLFGEAA